VNATDDRAFVEAGDLLTRRVGLRLDPSERGRLSRCIVAGARARGLPPREYVSQLDTDPVALQDLLDRVTVQETAFFRDRAQFDAFASEIAPRLEEPVTIWSAGCANGQEPYSLAMVLDELGFREFRIAATDVSTRALARTRTARYSESEVKGLSASRRGRYLRAVDAGFEIVPELRAHIDVAPHNLAADPPPFAPGSCPVVLCRNVLIYFSRTDVEAFLDRLADWLPPLGWLFLGYSESLWQVTDRFQLQHVGEAFLYRRHDPGRPAAPLRAQSPPQRAQLLRSPVPAPALPERRQSEPRPAPAEVRPEGIVELLATGEAAAQAGDHASAIAAFRKCTYLDHSEPLAHLYLGLALEASGDRSAARRAYGAARTALHRCEAATVEATLEGYHPAELARLLDAKLAESQ
jgi:chemotaxis methyl-accepting protein methylase